MTLEGETVFPGQSRSGIHENVAAPQTGTVLGKVGCILQAFSTDNATLGISEIARTTGLAKATVYRLCTEMAELGLLDRHWSQFQLGLRLFELGSMVQRQRLLRDLATPFLQDLRLKTNETIHLGIPADGEVFYVVRLTGHQSHTAPSRLAGRAPMHCTATGKAMLAHLPSELVDSLMSRPLEKFTKFTILARNVLDDELARTRSTGVAVENEEMSLSFRSVAAPIFGPGRRLLGAVSVTGPTSRVKIDSVATEVRTAANQISDRAATYWDLV
ncbi:MAG: DNA-binding IclR family transcriptional regulator [Acidimicrobiales bacterium]|jgi:DNA-binding IclR family transcriptional regulator